MSNENALANPEVITMLEEKNLKLLERERDLAEKQEELQAQKEELTAAIEELVNKNNSLTDALIQLQKRNKELDLLLYRASHDLKTPVSSIQGLINLMESELTTPEQKQLLEFIEQKTSQMNDVLKSMTMLAQASFEKIQPEKVNLRAITDQVMKDLSYLPNFKNVDVFYNYGNTLETITDELVIYNILKCLISNAIIFRDPLTHGNVWIDFSYQQDLLLIEITDDGDGISPEISGDIFNMFFRGSERSHGAGLGLYIVKNAVDRMKGTIRWISKMGKTTFQVTLPKINFNNQ
jgi:signal transduction histidine kinase